MRQSARAVTLCGLLTLLGNEGISESPPNPALNEPDKLAWEIFLQVNARATGTIATFETWPATQTPSR